MILSVKDQRDTPITYGWVMVINPWRGVGRVGYLCRGLLGGTILSGVESVK